jgi:hypothetical protein
MTGPHHFVFILICGGLAWLLPAGPRTEWSQRSMVDRVLPAGGVGLRRRGSGIVWVWTGGVRLLYGEFDGPDGFGGSGDVQGLGLFIE